MANNLSALLVVVCLVGYGSLLTCHTCINGEECLYGTKHKYDLEQCAPRQDRCFLVKIRRGNSWARPDFEWGCADQDFCTLEMNKQNSNYDVSGCQLCDSDGCNSAGFYS